MLFFDRQWLLKVLYDCVQQKDRILVNQRVETIKPTETGVEVVTASGQTFTGDVVIGADGIHSTVRREMRRIAEATRPGYFRADEEDKVPCHYKCSFGIAKEVEGWPKSEQCFTLGRGKSFLVASGPENRCYWFLFVKLPEPLYGKNIPRYSREDEAQFIKENGSLQITEELTFAQVFAKRETSALTALHEVTYDKWFLDRMLLIGDSAHKVCLLLRKVSSPILTRLVIAQSYWRYGR
jgi:2-polyprenyl-6-methoxyphenol hydroxylase-like FAD-dependent oxidoreductase